MKEDMKLLGFYNYTVVLTYIGMLTGFIGILYAFEEKYSLSMVCLMVAGFCDMFDGTIASTRKRTKQEKSFGIQIDSLSDLICFGILPAVNLCCMEKGNTFFTSIGCFYVLCALIRLAYFNVDEQERQEKENGGRAVFYGLPVTSAALFLPIAYGLTSRWDWGISAVMASIMGDMAVMFLLPFQLKKPEVKGKVCMFMMGLAEFILLIMTFGDAL